MGRHEGSAGDAHWVEVAAAWFAQDPDETTRAELAPIIEQAELGDVTATEALRDRFAQRLEFGTAGLRGELGAGSNRMNRVLVAQAAAGLAAWLVGRGGDPSIVVGYDGRTNSSAFARDTAEIMQAAGVRAILLPRLLPTPVLAFAVRHLGASAGVMVTASHNPAADNGYKVYLGDADGGSQIVAPVDSEIAAHIREVATGSIVDLPRANDYEVAGEDVVDAYVTATAGLVSAPAPGLRYVYTAMHGVGWETASRVFAAAGFDAPTPVEQQLHPDAAFSTVAFPNPEEPGALDLSIALARSTEADLVIANDPDADRLGVAIPTASGWRRLTGNEIGQLLGWRAAARSSSGALACSLVSSPALATIAAEHSLDFVETLTGFKWISRAPELVFGYEEALGYLVDPEVIRDKDGISAAADFLALASELKAAGSTVEQHLEAFAERFGGFASGQISLRVADLADIPRIMTRLRETPPAQIGERRVKGVDDYLLGVDGFGPNDILRFRLRGGARVIVRPSGTEPKLKVYLDAWSSKGTGAERLAAAEAKIVELDAAMRELVR